MKYKFQDIHRGYTGCIYVAELANNLVKVGFSANPKTRLEKLEYQVRHKYLTTICRYHVSANLPKRLAQKIENESLKSIRATGLQVDRTLEYFSGIGFSDAVALIDRVISKEQVLA